MEYSYTLQEGELLLNNSSKNKCIIYCMRFLQFLKLLLYMFIFALTVYITYIIFRRCIAEITLRNCIPLGSIFATFGSAVISVFSLYCNKQIKFYQENLSALHEQIPEMSSWKRWPFLKRYDKERIGLWKYNYYTLKNPQITFKCSDLCLKIPLPTCTADFYDLPIFFYAIKMAYFRKFLLNSIFGLQRAGLHKDLFILHCTLMIYRNIIRYKLGSFFILLGSGFVLSSIIFSFLYKPINEFVLFTASYFS